MSRKPQTLWLIAAIGLIGVTGEARGQETLSANQRAPEATNVPTVDSTSAVMDIVRTMVEEAVTLERPGHHLEAARLYEAAASLLPKSDPDAFEYRSRAAALCYHGGDLDRALELFEGIGREATDFGNTEVASDAYEQAMYIAYEQGDKPQAREFYLKSLSQEERDNLLERWKRRQ